MQNSKFESTKNPSKRSMRLGDKLLDLSTPKVMGILNVTPDSFFDGNQHNTLDLALKRTEKMIDEGVDIIDIGGHSTRPNADDISEQEEIERILPTIKSIKKHFPSAIISLDTFRGNVAEIGINEGVDIINDVSGFQIDSNIADVAAKHSVPYILMHMKGTPETMQSMTEYNNLFGDIIKYFSEKLAVLKSKGVKDVVIDPGFGFAKTIDQNYELIQNLEHFGILDLPVLVGVSRKSMIYKKLGTTAEESLNGTIALNAIALSKGASILRVHDVKEAKELIQLLK